MIPALVEAGRNIKNAVEENNLIHTDMKHFKENMGIQGAKRYIYEQYRKKFQGILLSKAK